MTRIAAPQLPELSPAAQSLADAVGRCVREAEDLSGWSFADEALAGAVSRLEVRACRFDRCRFSGCRFDRAGFTDVVFCGCDFSNADLSRCSLLRCRFEDCKGIGLSLVRAVLRSVTFERCRLDYANFSDAALHGVRMRQTALGESVWLSAKLDGAAWKGCRLDGANLSGTSLRGMDLTTDSLEGLLLGGEELRGATVTPYQAAGFARLLGLEVKWESRE